MSNVFGFNIKPHNIWANRNKDNQFKVDGMTVDEWVKAGDPKEKRTYEDFWNIIRPKKLEENFNTIWKSSSTPSEFPLDGLFRMLHSTDDKSTYRTLNTINEWEKFADIKKHGGQAIGFDLETFGNITDTETAPAKFGITEFAFGTRTYNGTSIVDKRGYSFVLGLNDEQYKYLTELSKKYETSGWNSLTKDERVTLGRMSMYSRKSSIRDEYISDFGGNKKFKIAGELSPETRNVSSINAGIENLRKAYTNAEVKPKEVFELLVDKLISASDDSNTVLYGANSEFDITSIVNFGKTIGADVNKVESLKNKVLDVIYSARALARSESMSVNQYFETMHGIKAGADMEGQLEVYRFRNTQTHQGIEDVWNEGDVLDIRVKEVLDSKNKLLEIGEDYKQHKNLKDSVFLVNRGTLNQRHAQEMGIVDKTSIVEGQVQTKSTPVSNYSFTNEYWKIDSEHSGYVELDGEQKYKLVLDNYIDDDNTKIVLIRDSEEKAIEDLSRNSNIFSKEQVTQSNARKQQSFKYKDFGRREFSKLISPSDTGADKGIDMYGFETLKGYLKLVDEIPDGIITDTDSKSVNRLMEYIDSHYEQNKTKKKADVTLKDLEKHFESDNAVKTFLNKTKIYFELKDDASIDDVLEHSDMYQDKKAVQQVRQYLSDYSVKKPIKSYYQAQAFVGMYSKLKNEKPLLKNIVEKIDAKYGDAENVDKTIIARNAYEESIEHLDLVHGRKTASAKYDVMTDALGIDIEIPKDGSIRRINGYSSSTIAYDVNRIFGKLTNEDAVKILNDLNDRALFLDEKAFFEIRNRVSRMTKDDIYSISQDIGYELSKYTEEYTSKNSSITNAFEKDTKVKNKELLGQELETDRNITFKKKTFEKAYSESSNQIDKIISNAINNSHEITYVNTFSEKKALKNYINDIAEHLNIGQMPPADSDLDKTGANLLYELFTKTKDWKGEPTSYAINNYVKDGLSTFLMEADNGNAYLFMTREQDAARFYTNLIDGKFDFSSRHNLTYGDPEKGFLPIHDYASFVEISKINEYELSDGRKLRTIRQGGINGTGGIEKIIIPELNVYSSNGKTRAYYNSGEFGYLSTLRQSMGGAIRHVLEGEYEEGSSTVRKAQNAYLDELSASASYRGRVLTDKLGNITGIERIAEFTPSDYIQADEARIGEGLHKLFNVAVLDNTEEEFNPVQKIVKAFGEKANIYQYKDETDIQYISRIANDSEFKEFFNKRLFVGTVSEDAYIGDKLIGPEFDKNIFNIIKDMASDETTYLFDESVAKALDKIPDETVNPVISESTIDKGIYSYGTRPGDYNDSSNLHSILRPTYHQQNNALAFSLDEIDMGKFEGLESNSVRFTAVIAEKEYNDRMALAKNGYQPVQGKDYASRRRSMITRVKQMNDYELQLKYIEMQENASIIAEELGISESRYNKALKFFQQDYMSLYEGKFFLAPGLNEQKVFQERDVKKITYNTDNLDIDKSRKILYSLAGNNTTLTRDTIIGVKANGTPLYYQGPDAKITMTNVHEMLDQNKTYVVPLQGDIFDNKVMVNGSEKGTTHSINMTKFMEYTGIKDYNKALKTANSLFNKAFDGVSVVGTFGFEKHGNINSIHSIWNTITSQYIEQGQGNLLVNHLNRLINEREEFAGFGKFKYINGEIISSSTNARNYSTAIEYLYNQIANDEALKSNINADIVAELEELKETKTFNAVLQKQNMNEHMGSKLIIDQRLEQGIRTRGMQLGGSGMDPLDNKWADMLKTYSLNYNAQSTIPKKEKNNLQKFIDAYGKNKNASRISLLQGTTDIQRSAKGIVESFMYYYNPTKYDPTNKNIVKININDLIDEGIKLKGGITTKELQRSIFFIDGKPSDFLKKQASKSGVDLYHNSYSILIDLNKTSFKVTDVIDGKQSTRTFSKGVLVPIQSVLSETTTDEHFFQKQQGIVTRFINKLVDITNNPQKYKDIGVETALSQSYSTMMASLSEQIGYLNKDTDVYKAFQQYVMPTSQELLAQDESAPLVRELMDEDIQKLIKSEEGIEALEKRIQINPDNKEAIKKLDILYNDLKNKLTNIADNVRNDYGYYSELMSLSSNPNLLKASELTGHKGQKQYGLAIAISEEAFERQGINIGAVGLDIFSDWEKGVGDPYYQYNFENLKEFSNHLEGGHNIGAKKRTIAKKLNDLGIEGLKIDSKFSITEQLNEYITETYGSESRAISIKDLNKAIVEGKKGPTEILGVFRDLGKQYLSEVGTYGELTRFPAFRSQAMVKVILDENLTGIQVRGSSAIISSFSNVDFDGDKQFLAMITDGISVVNKKTRIEGKQVLDVQREIYERFANTESRELLADLIEKGDMFEIDNPNATIKQYAAILEKLKPDVYEEAVMKWANDNSIRVSSIGDLTKAQIFAASNSKQMHKAFTSIGFNTINDKDSILAAIASRYRKKNIGSISTPNYHMRNALLIAMQDPKMSHEQKRLLNDTYVSLTNMLSKAGGFFDMAEQKSIDVKHAKDGLNVAKTTRYSAGMSLLFGSEKHTLNKNIAGIRNILDATNSGIFKATDKELEQYANLVANTTDEAFEKGLKNLKEDTANNLRTLRTLIDVQKQVPGLSKIYSNRLIRGSLDERVHEVIQQIEVLNSGNLSDLKNIYYGTGFYNVLDTFANTFSADKAKFVKNNVYFMPGDLSDWKDKAYLYMGNRNFAQVDFLTGEKTGEYLNYKEVSKLIDASPDTNGINFREFTKGTNQEKIDEALRTEKFKRTLNSVLFKEGELRSQIPDSFNKIGNAKKGIDKYGIAWIGVDQLFTGKKSQGRQTSVIYENINQLAKAYDYAITKDFIDVTKHPDSSGALIKQINEEIAKNPKHRNSNNEYIFPEEYDTILRNQISKIFGGEDILENYIQESQDMSSVFDDKAKVKYQKAKDFLKENTYDIIEQQNTIRGSIESVQIELDGLRKQGVSDEELKPLQDIIDSSASKTNDLLKALRAENEIVVKSVQQDIYSLFDSTSQMESFFGWGRASDNTIVGFGDYIGQSFKNLSKSDAQAILEAGELAKKSIQSMSTKERYAVTSTINALSNYKAHAKYPGSVALKTSKEVSAFVSDNQKAITEVVKQLQNRAPEQISEASKRAASQQVKKKTLSGSIFDSTKDAFNKIPKKTVGIAAASLAALGIVNNALHHQKNKSPLSPERQSKHNSPETNNGSVQRPAVQQAPMSQRRTVYHDNSNGFNFKVSAKTKNYIDDMNNAKLIGMSGGGNTSVYSQSDTSGVTDNWLANKFAELT